MKDQILNNDFSLVDELHQKFIAKGGREVAGPITNVETVGDEAGDSEEDEEDDDEEMGDAPAPTGELGTETTARLEKIVDEDGFELVQKKKGRR